MISEDWEGKKGLAIWLLSWASVALIFLLIRLIVANGT